MNIRFCHVYTFICFLKPQTQDLTAWIKNSTFADPKDDAVNRFTAESSSISPDSLSDLGFMTFSLEVFQDLGPSQGYLYHENCHWQLVSVRRRPTAGSRCFQWSPQMVVRVGWGLHEA